ncbi:calmodulin-like [Ctenocephalides felis]|uniref:calmodulin-like n=1 Tax=Ctenocephalides felis TaxID=7515 RepID=UPI000E6E1260|nr:calmodulin-like [Ctenocephalides felis]
MNIGLQVELNAEKFKDVKLAFELFDKDKSGFLDRSTARQLMLYLGHNCTEADLTDMTKATDPEKTDQISLDAFKEYYFKNMHFEFTDDEIKEAFNLLDLSGRGSVSGDDLARMNRLFGSLYTANELEDMMSSADLDGDHFLSYEEFEQVMIA